MHLNLGSGHVYDLLDRTILPVLLWYDLRSFRTCVRDLRRRDIRNLAERDRAERR